MSLINFVLPNKTSSNRSCEHIREQIKKKENEVRYRKQRI